MKRNRFFIVMLLATAFAGFSNVAIAQVSISSPYSLFGIGSLYTNSHQALMGMGGSSAAYSSPFFINPANPASYAAMDTNSFVFDGGLVLSSGKLKTADNSQRTRSGSLANVSFGFPITKWLKTSLGVLPYSNMGYQIQDDKITPNIGRHVDIYKGGGGLNKAYAGISIEPVKGFSFGVNSAYLFGNIEKSRAITFPDSAGYINSMYKTSTRLANPVFDFGLLYRANLKKGNYIQFGLTFTPKQSLKGHAEKILYSYQHDYNSNIDLPLDTISSEIGNDGKVTLPASLGAGFLFGNGYRWLVMADMNYQKWRQFSYLGQSSNLYDNYRFSVGGQYRPSVIGIGKYWERIIYRAGFRYELGNLKLQGSRINNFGISFGTGLPMRKSRSTLNLSIEAGSQGTTANGLIKDSYVRFAIGAAIQERWFLKPKYN